MTKCQQAFDNLKTWFTSEPVLMMPDQTKPFQIKCDTSKYASGAVLTQLDSNGDRHLCVFISKMFSPTERNYEIYDQELLAIIQALEEWRHYIQGSPHTTVIFSDHKNLTYFRGARKLNWQQAWWSLYLSEFDVKLVHIAGTKIIQADVLSRWLDFIPGEDTDNKNITMLPDTLFVNVIDTELQEWILNCEKLDSDTMEALKVLLEEGPTTIWNQLPDWTVEHVEEKQVLYYQGKNYISKDKELWQDIAKITQQQDTLENWKHIIPSDNITGGQAWEHTLKTTFKGAEHVNSSRSTNNWQSPLFSL